MTIHIVVGRVEGFVSSIGFISEGMPFMCRGTKGTGLHWEGKEAKLRAIRELRILIAHLIQAGNVVDNAELLDKLELEG